MRMASSRRVTPRRGDLAGEHRLAERGLHERLGGEVVDLVRAVLARASSIIDDLVEQVAGDERRSGPGGGRCARSSPSSERRTMPMTS